MPRSALRPSRLEGRGSRAQALAGRRRRSRPSEASLVGLGLLGLSAFGASGGAAGSGAGDGEPGSEPAVRMSLFRKGHTCTLRKVFAGFSEVFEGFRKAFGAFRKVFAGVRRFSGSRRSSSALAPSGASPTPAPFGPGPHGRLLGHLSNPFGGLLGASGGTLGAVLRTLPCPPGPRAPLRARASKGLAPLDSVPLTGFDRTPQGDPARQDPPFGPRGPRLEDRGVRTCGGGVD